MSQWFHAENWLSPDGVPNGGVVKLITAHPKDPPGSGTLGEQALNNPALYIRWQQGPLVVDGVRQEPNGCFVETVIEAALQRMEHYQDTRFACVENQEIIDHLRKALAWCQERTARREARNVEGTSEV